MRPSSVNLSVTLSSPKPLGGIQPKLLHHLLMVMVCESNIFFPCVRRQSICLSRYLLLNHWTEFNQTCLINIPHGKGVREQHYCSVRPSSIHMSVTLRLNQWAESNQTWLHHFPLWLGCARATLFFSVSVRASVVYLFVCHAVFS